MGEAFVGRPHVQVADTLAGLYESCSGGWEAGKHTCRYDDEGLERFLDTWKQAEYFETVLSQGCLRLNRCRCFFA